MLLHDIECFVAQLRQISRLIWPERQGALEPLHVVPAGEILPEMRTATLRSPQRAIGDAHCQLEHLLQTVGCDQLGIDPTGLAPQPD